jgi:hypothetical protein
MATIVISPCNVVNFLDGGGGHFWVYLQYALGLKQLGCDVYWLEQVRGGGGGGGENGSTAKTAVVAFADLMERFGLAGKFILYPEDGGAGTGRPLAEYVGISRTEAESVFRRADLLLNFHYAMDPTLLACFRRTALVDIDPGLLQFWIVTGQLRVAPHDVYLTTGETVGTLAARFSDCGLTWRHIRPPVCLDAWPYQNGPARDAFTTVSNWWGHDDWIIDGHGNNYENNKRVTFLEFADLPRRTTQPLELALYLSDSELDARDRTLMEGRGWRVRHSVEVARTPLMYQSYVQGSRGEFSCVKPSCIKFQNGWVSDRTLCYLASGKPAVVQHTGPSSYLPSGEGMFRFSTIEDAANALAAVNADYERHRRAARDIAETHFDAKHVLRRALSHAGL